MQCEGCQMVNTICWIMSFVSTNIHMYIKLAALHVICKAHPASGTVANTLQCCCSLTIIVSDQIGKLTMYVVSTHSDKAVPLHSCEVLYLFL
jgi:hypothetical protein